MNTHSLPETEPPHLDSQEADDAHSEKLSDLLARLAAEPGEKVTIRQIAEALEDRSFGAFLLVFSIPNLIPLPPGATLILGLPMIFVAWQMLMGREKIWLPKVLADYAIDHARFEAMVARVSPWLKRGENWVRPRKWPITGPLRERLFGLYALLLSIVCAVPIPFGNWLPAFAVGVLGVAHTERDGYCLAAGVVIGIASLFVAAIVVMVTGVLLMRIF